MGCHDPSDLLAASQDLARFVEETVSGRNPLGNRWGPMGATLILDVSACDFFPGFFLMVS